MSTFDMFYRLVQQDASSSPSGSTTAPPGLPDLATIGSWDTSLPADGDDLLNDPTQTWSQSTPSNPTSSTQPMWAVARVLMTEGLSQLYEVDVTIFYEEQLDALPSNTSTNFVEQLVFGSSTTTNPPMNCGAPLAPADYLAKRGTVLVARSTDSSGTTSTTSTTAPTTGRWMTGIVTQFEDLGNALVTNYRLANLTIRPALWLLSLRTNCRIFQNLSSMEIIDQVLTQANLYAEGSSVTRVYQNPSGGTDATSWTQKREYCVQYNETDLNFVLRLLEEEGITFYFNHSKDGEQIVFTEDLSKCTQIKTADTDGSLSVKAQTDWSSVNQTTEVAWSVVISTRVQTQRVHLRDYNYFDPLNVRDHDAGDTYVTAPGSTGSGSGTKFDDNSQTVQTPPAVLGPSLEVYEYPGGEIFDVKQASGSAGSQNAQASYSAGGSSGSQGATSGPHIGDSYAPFDSGARPSGSTPSGGSSSSVSFADIRLDGYKAARERGRGRSNFTSMQPGATVQMTGFTDQVFKYSSGNTPGQMVITKAEHLGYASGTARTNVLALFPDKMAGYDSKELSSTGTEYYFNKFEFLDLQLDTSGSNPTKFRPQRVTPRPLINGLQTALVVDDTNDVDAQTLPDDQIPVENLSRVKIRFHWDTRAETNPPNPSTQSSGSTPSTKAITAWVRVAQPWAGNGFGVIFMPRFGEEVAVAFVDGNPDYPLIVGTLYNATHQSALVEPGPTVPKPDGDPNAQQNPPPATPTPSTSRVGFRTRSHKEDSSDPVGNDYNEFSFDDKKDGELVYTRAQRDLRVEAIHTHQTEVMVDQFNKVDGDQLEQVDTDQTVIVHADRTVTVDKIDYGTVGGKRTTTVHGNDEVTLISMNREESVDGNEDVKIGTTPFPNPTLPPARKHTIAGTRTQTVKLTDLVTVGSKDDPSMLGNQTINVQKGKNTVTASPVVMNTVGPPAGTPGAKPDGTKMQIQVDPKDGVSLNTSGTPGNLSIYTHGDAKNPLSGPAELQVLADTTLELLAPSGEIELATGTPPTDASGIITAAAVSNDGGTAKVSSTKMHLADGYIDVKADNSIYLYTGTTTGQPSDTSTYIKLEAGAILFHMGAADGTSQIFQMKITADGGDAYDGGKKGIDLQADSIDFASGAITVTSKQGVNVQDGQQKYRVLSSDEEKSLKDAADAEATFRNAKDAAGKATDDRAKAKDDFTKAAADGLAAAKTFQDADEKMRYWQKERDHWKDEVSNLTDQQGKAQREWKYWADDDRQGGDPAPFFEAVGNSFHSAKSNETKFKALYDSLTSQVQNATDKMNDAQTQLDSATTAQASAKTARDAALDKVMKTSESMENATGTESKAYGDLNEANMKAVSLHDQAQKKVAYQPET